MPTPTLYFDRNFGIRFPQALLHLRLRIEHHAAHFPQDEKDDKWLEHAGRWGWVVLSHDRKFHLLDNEKAAIKQYKVGCFYLWGANATTWDKMKVFARAYDRIIDLATKTPTPYIFDVRKDGRIVRVPI